MFAGRLPNRRYVNSSSQDYAHSAIASRQDDEQYNYRLHNRPRSLVMVSASYWPLTVNGVLMVPSELVFEHLIMHKTLGRAMKPRIMTNENTAKRIDKSNIKPGTFSLNKPRVQHTQSAPLSIMLTARRRHRWLLPLERVNNPTFSNESVVSIPVLREIWKPQSLVTVQLSCILKRCS